MLTYGALGHVYTVKLLCWKAHRETLRVCGEGEEPSPARHVSTDILDLLSRAATSQLPLSDPKWYHHSAEELPRQAFSKFLTHEIRRWIQLV